MGEPPTFARGAFRGRPSDGFQLWHFSSVSDYRPPLPKAMGCFSLDSIVIDSHFKDYFFHFVTSANLFHQWLAIAFAWRLRHQQLDALRQYYSFCFFVALLLGIAFFNCYVLRATLIFEKANAALGRYFSPDIKNEIEDADSVFANQEPKDMRVAVMFTDLISCTKTSESMDPKEVLKHCQNIRQSRWTAFLNLAVRSINLLVMPWWPISALLVLTETMHKTRLTVPWWCIAGWMNGTVNGSPLDSIRSITVLASTMMIALWETWEVSRGLNLQLLATRWMWQAVSVMPANSTIQIFLLAVKWLNK